MDKQYSTEQLANWGRDYLRCNFDFNKIVIDAKTGTVEAKAALSIMSGNKDELAFQNDRFPNVSLEMAKDAIKLVGLEPPYYIPYQTLIRKDKTDYMCTATIVIDKNFNIKYNDIKMTELYSDLADEWDIEI